MTYWCEKCGRNHKLDSKIGVKHMPNEVFKNTMIARANVTQEPEPTPKGVTDGEVPENPDIVNGDVSLPNPAIESSAPPGSEGFEAYIAHFNEQVNTLSVNDQIMSKQLQDIRELLSGDPGTAIQPTEAWEGWTFDSIPEWLRKPLTKFMGDLGAGFRAFAGDQSATEDEQVVRAAVKIMRDKSDSRIADRAALIAGAMEDPDTEIYSRKKPEKKPDEKDVKKVG